MTGPEVTAFLDKAGESIATANELIERGSFGFAASRAYYAMFYCAEALLLNEGKSYSRHSAVIAAFGRELVKPGLLDSRSTGTSVRPLMPARWPITSRFVRSPGKQPSGR